MYINILIINLLPTSLRKKIFNVHSRFDCLIHQLLAHFRNQSNQWISIPIHFIDFFAVRAQSSSIAAAPMTFYVRIQLHFPTLFLCRRKTRFPGKAHFKNYAR